MNHEEETIMEDRTGICSDTDEARSRPPSPKEEPRPTSPEKWNPFYKPGQAKWKVDISHIQPTFSGAVNENVVDFLRTAEANLFDAGVPESYWPRATFQWLDGAAKSLMQSAIENGVSWSRFSMMLRERFGGIHMETRGMVALFSEQQGQTPAAEYVQKKEALYYRWSPHTPERTMVNIIVELANPTFRDAAKPIPYTLDELMCRALQHPEPRNTTTRQEQPPPPRRTNQPPQCHYCPRGTLHYHRHCPRMSGNGQGDEQAGARPIPNN